MIVVVVVELAEVFAQQRKRVETSMKAEAAGAEHHIFLPESMKVGSWDGGME